MARVIVDAGPLIAFARVGFLDLFRQMFGEVCVVEAVRKECLAGPGGGDGRLLEEMMRAQWVRICHPAVADAPLSLSLGDGERDSIHLAMQEPSTSLLVMDDYLARKQAIRHGCSVIGTVRLLDEAERDHLIDSAELLIADMQRHGYRISRTILERLRQGG